MFASISISTCNYSHLCARLKFVTHATHRFSSNLQLFNGNTVLEAVYLLNASKSADYQLYTNAYAELQLNVLRLLAEAKGITVTDNLDKARAEILDVIKFEADLANVSRKF